jgi:Fic family protein
MLQFPLPPPTTNFIQQLTHVTALATALRTLPLTDHHAHYLHHLQTLKSSLFSARIEGNTLSLIKVKDIDLSNPKDASQLEITNLLKAEKKLDTAPTPLSKNQLLEWHQIIMAGLANQAGKLRTESSAIYDGFGNIIYLTPSPSEMKKMLASLLVEVNGPVVPSHHYLLNMAACHYYFEKTHPF